MKPKFKKGDILIWIENPTHFMIIKIFDISLKEIEEKGNLLEYPPLYKFKTILPDKDKYYNYWEIAYIERFFRKITNEEIMEYAL